MISPHALPSARRRSKRASTVPQLSARFGIVADNLARNVHHDFVLAFLGLDQDGRGPASADALDAPLLLALVLVVGLLLRGRRVLAFLLAAIAGPAAAAAGEAVLLLATLAEPGESQFLTAVKPCGILLPHVHQRANEFYSVIFGAPLGRHLRCSKLNPELI
ncbi:MAG: hypothetical protein HC767_06555 [Akkermansiaceae bacterium]|nr:hypothetical protein [Akkermansiaceae bacterium]